ncbi:dehydrogenase E1 component subunit alpha/beta [Mariniphaga sediminis]|uniref:dehydrogenase E1 component subunit alpha/beta n=1 Tax=Mariniphaga sediminis TaxID=1628158 RepID=UPI00356AF696
MKFLKVTPELDYKKIIVSQNDYEGTDPNLLAGMAFEIFLIREFENMLLTLADGGCIHGPVHTSIGQEACAAGAMSVLNPTDKIASTHRAHHHYLAKLIGSYFSAGFNILKDKIPETLTEGVTQLLGEVMGLSVGCCGGRGGSMHLRNKEIGFIGSNAIVAGGVPLATGAAFASKFNKRKEVTVCFLGDGAVHQGAFHEAINLAGIWELPIIYVIENNQYAVGTSVKAAAGMDDLAQKGSAYRCVSRIVDGMDPLAVMLAVNEAKEIIEKVKKPVLIEAKCYRFPHHAGPVSGSNFGYRTKEEEEKWRKKDPYTAYPDKLAEYNLLSDEQIEQIKEKSNGIVQAAVDHCTILEGKNFIVKDGLWPDIKKVEYGLRSEGTEFNDILFREKEDFKTFEEIIYSDAIAAVTGRNMEKDNNVFVLGEEVAHFGGGPYGATKGLFQKYPDRVLNTPISEAGFTGLAGGAAMDGLYPVVEIMFADFTLVAADQLFNQIGKLRHMYGNTTHMPVVVRIRIATGCGYGGQHSMDPVGLYSLFSGWRIIAPSNAFDYVGLFNSAIRSTDPVLLLEHNKLYPQKFDIPAGNLDYFVKMGKANVIRSGSDVTVLSYSSGVKLCAEAAEELVKEGIETEIIDLRTVSPADIDYELIGQSLKKTGAILVVEQASKSLGIGKGIAYECQMRFFDYLDSPTALVNSLDIPPPVSKPLEEECLPGITQVRNMIFRVARRKV